MTRHLLRPLVGLFAIVSVVALFVLSANLFRGGFAKNRPGHRHLAARGLVMNADAKVQIRGVQVGRVSDIEALPTGEAAIHLAIDPAMLDAVPRQRAGRHRVADGIRCQTSAIRVPPTTPRRNRCVPAR